MAQSFNGTVIRIEGTEALVSVTFGDRDELKLVDVHKLTEADDWSEGASLRFHFNTAYNPENGFDFDRVDRVLDSTDVEENVISDAELKSRENRLPRL